MAEKLGSFLINFLFVFGIYSLIVLTTTLVLIFKKEFSKSIIFLLIILWIPVVIGSIFWLLIIRPEIILRPLDFLRAFYVLGGPLIFILLGFFLIWELIKFLWRL
ncbi:MAG: hypothetical protein ABIK78_00375 [candidate division WOR-3 bacterium]